MSINFDKIGEIFSDFGSKIAETYDASIEAIKKKAEESGVQQYFEDAWSSLGDVNDKVQQSLTNLKDASADKIESAYNEATEALAKAQESVKQKIAELKDDDDSKVGNAMNEVSSYYEKLSAELKEKYQSLVDSKDDADQDHQDPTKNA